MSPVTFAIAIVAATIVGPALLVLLVEGSYHLGKLVSKAEIQDAKYDALIATINELRRELRETKRLVRQANRPHDRMRVRSD